MEQYNSSTGCYLWKMSLPFLRPLSVLNELLQAYCRVSLVPYLQVRGLYRGMSAPLIGGALETGDLSCPASSRPLFVEPVRQRLRSNL